MKVREVIKDAARLIGDESLYSALGDETTALTGDNQKKTDVMLKCYNDAQYEVATKYLPIIAEETFSGGKILYKSFKRTPSKILKVSENGEIVDYENGVDYLIVKNGKIVVKYEYIPADKSINDDFDYANTKIGKVPFAYAVAASYCLIAGRFSEAKNWESRFSEYLETPSKRYSGRIKNKRIWR